MKRGLNSAEMQKSNRILVFQTLLEKPGETRAKLATDLGLQKATITNIINEFYDLDIVAVNGEAASGRRGEKLSLKLEGMYVMTLGVTRKDCQLAIYSLDGEELELRKYRFGRTENLRTALDALERDALKFMERYGREAIFDICLAVPGLYIRDKKKGTEHYLVSEFYGWKEIDIRAELEERFGRPIEIVHDVKLSAYAEWRNAPEVAADRNASLVIVRSRGFGIGAGIIIGGKILEGQLGIAGELGHMGIDYHAKDRLLGSFESFGGVESAVRYMKQRLSEFPESPLDEDSGYYDVLKAYGEGDTLAVWIMEKIAWVLGYGLSNVIYTINPDCIILGADYPQGEEFLSKVRETILRFVPDEIVESAHIRSSGLAKDSFLLGGYYYLMEKMMHDNSIIEKIEEFRAGGGAKQPVHIS